MDIKTMLSIEHPTWTMHKCQPGHVRKSFNPTGTGDFLLDAGYSFINSQRSYDISKCYFRTCCILK